MHHLTNQQINQPMNQPPNQPNLLKVAQVTQGEATEEAHGHQKDDWVKQEHQETYMKVKGVRLCWGQGAGGGRSVT